MKIQELWIHKSNKKWSDYLLKHIYMNNYCNLDIQQLLFQINIFNLATSSVFKIHTLIWHNTQHTSTQAHTTNTHTCSPWRRGHRILGWILRHLLMVGGTAVGSSWILWPKWQVCKRAEPLTDRKYQEHHGNGGLPSERWWTSYDWWGEQGAQCQQKCGVTESDSNQRATVGKHNPHLQGHRDGTHSGVCAESQTSAAC